MSAKKTTPRKKQPAAKAGQTTEQVQASMRKNLRFSFGATITDALDTQGISGREFTRRIGRTSAQLVHWKNGDYLSVTDETLRLVLDHVSSLPATKMRVLCAYLMDMTPPEYRGMVVIQPAINRAPTVDMGRAAEDLREKLQAIVDCAHLDADLKTAVDALGSWALRLKARQKEESRASKK